MFSHYNTCANSNNCVSFHLQVSWGSVAIFTTGKTQRATGLSVMTSSERQVLCALASDMRVRKQKKKKEKIKEELNEKTMAHIPSL